MRSKEEAMDYRYFPDPDLIPTQISKEWIQTLQHNLPELPEIKKTRYLAWGLSEENIQKLIQTAELAEYFESVAKKAKHPKQAANWIIESLVPHFTEANIPFNAQHIPAEELASLIQKIEDGTLSNKTGKIVLESLFAQEGSVSEIIQVKALVQISDASSLQAYVDELFQNFPNQIEELRSGKEKILGFLLGQVMKKSQGKANPALIEKLIQERLMH